MAEDLVFLRSERSIHDHGVGELSRGPAVPSDFGTADEPEPPFKPTPPSD